MPLPPLARAGLPRDVLSASGMRRFTLLELSGMELHEVAHVRRCLAGELAHGRRPKGVYIIAGFGVASPAPTRYSLNVWPGSSLTDGRSKKGEIKRNPASGDCSVP